MIAIYARQSVDKRDSISVDSQIDFCKKEIGDISDEIKVYSDKGFTGSNTNRPQFQNMLSALREGDITKVWVYKLDRISRSILDFANLMDIFDRNKIEFISYTEKFDTTNPMGKAMLNIIMTFAQLERETIQLRVKDNFYQRGERGHFLAGIAPIGFVKVPTKIDNINTSKLEVDPNTEMLIKYIYSEYMQINASIGSIIKKINSEYEIYGLKKPLESSRCSRILRNPVYAKCDAEIYMYLKNKGAIMNEDISEYDGTRGCTIYGERKKKTTSKFTNIKGDHVQLNLHNGIIEPALWLRAQYKLDKNKQVKNEGKGKHSWLSGIIKCGYCNLAINVVNGQRNGKRYITCGGRKQKFCYERKEPITFDNLEELVEDNLLKYMNEYKYSVVTKYKNNEYEINKVRIQLNNVEKEINNVVDKMLKANDTMAVYLNQRIEELDKTKEELLQKVNVLNSVDTKQISNQEIDNYINTWKDLSIEEKKIIAKLFIKNVVVTDKKVEICYLISLKES